MNLVTQKLIPIKLETFMHWLESIKTFIFKALHGFRGYPLEFSGRVFRIDESLRRWNTNAEKSILNTIASHLEEGDLYVDVGANFGLHVLLAREIVGLKGKVIAFEPMPANTTLLRKNLQLNGYLNSIVLENAAVSDSPENSLEFFYENADLDVAASLDKSVGGRKSMKVRNVRLDDYQWPSDKFIKVMKIDVEGAEFSVLKSGKNLLKAHKPVLLIEIHTYTLKHFGTSREEILAFLTDLGYVEQIISYPGNKGESHYNAIYTIKL